MSLKKIVKEMGVIGASKILMRISSIILIPVLTKNLGAYGYGLWSQAFVTISLAVMVLTLGTPLSIGRLFPGKGLEEVGKDLSSLLAMIITLVGTFTVILYFFPETLANAVFDGNTLIVKIVSVIIFVSCLQKIFLAVFQAFREMKKLATINVITSYCEVGLAVILVLLGYGIVEAILSILIVRGSVSSVLYIIILRKVAMFKPNMLSLRKHLSLGVPVTPGAISHLIVDMSDRYVIGFFLGATFVGYYAPAYAFGMMVPLLMASVLATVLLPSLAEYYEKDNMHMVKKVLNLSTKYFLLISIPSFVGIIIVGKPILLLFTTEDIAQNGYIILILSGFAGILLGLYDICKNTVFLKKKTILITIFWVIGAGVNLLGNIVFVPREGIVAAGITTIVSYLLVTILVFNFARKNINFGLDFLPLAKIIFSSVSMGCILYIIKIQVWSNFIFLIILGLAIYLTTMYFIKGVDESEIDFLKGLHKG